MAELTGDRILSDLAKYQAQMRRAAMHVSDKHVTTLLVNPLHQSDFPDDSLRNVKVKFSALVEPHTALIFCNECQKNEFMDHLVAVNVPTKRSWT